jgi:Domain of unknown function (DUF4397)
MKVHVERLIPVFVLACAAVTYAAPAADTNAYFYLAHAAPGRSISSTTNPEFPVDVSIGGHCVSQGLSYGEIRGPVTLPAGTYSLKASVADAVNPCGGTVVFSYTLPFAPGTTSMGILTVSSNHVSAELVALDLSGVPAGEGWLLVANITPDKLVGTLTVDDTMSSPHSATFGARSFTYVPVPAGEYSATIYPEGSSTAATGPQAIDVVSRNLYVLVLAGSTANNSVQLLGPQVIRNVF